LRAITCIEGKRFSVEPAMADGVRRAGRRLQKFLRPRLHPIQEVDGQFIARGVVGTVDIGGVLLEVAPKTEPENDWIASVVDLIAGTDRIQPAGERAASLRAPRSGLLDALASIYAGLLENALNRDGPVTLLERQQFTSRRLNGKLNVTEWARSAAWKPHIFTVLRTRLSIDNDFCRAMAFVCDILGIASTSPNTQRLLRQFTSLLCPQPWQRNRWSPDVVSRVLPAQWAVFKPAWNICIAILSRHSPLGADRSHLGISIAFEAWPLLETLLVRALKASVREAARVHRKIAIAPKSPVKLLRHPNGTISDRCVIPDGRLIEDGRTIATFEAKYSVLDQTGIAFRQDVFQALCTAAACDSPLAVLVYPDSFDPTVWDAVAMGGRPGKLAVIGLGLYTYRSGSGDKTRGKAVVDLLRQ
jgi:hypothetical protein